MTGGALTRFWARVDKAGTCWLWTGEKTEKGYGRFHVDGARWKAHRFSWAAVNGPIPEGLAVLHRCDVPSCVRPAHLFLGTDADNMADCIAKGRHPTVKLTPIEVRAIRAAVDVPLHELARRYGVDRHTLRDIRDRKTWRQVA